MKHVYIIFLHVLLAKYHSAYLTLSYVLYLTGLYNCQININIAAALQFL